jgi:hypothetical protein
MQVEEHWVVKKRGYVVLVVSHVTCALVVNFTHLENSSGFAVFGPEVLWNFLNGINTDAIEIKFINNSIDPRF